MQRRNWSHHCYFYTAKSAVSNSVPASTKTANVLALFKKETELSTNQENWLNRLLPPQLQHISEHNLGHSHQWAYGKGHSIELLLVKMIEDWRRALDKNLVIGIVFVHFRKAVNSISHHVLLNKLQAVGVASDLWCWIKDYLADRSQATIVNGFQSETLPLKFVVPQGSVLGSTQFSVFCNDLPDVIEDCDSEIHMYADDTTI